MGAICKQPPGDGRYRRPEAAATPAPGNGGIRNI
jgi:hypothetical protein